MDLDLPTVLEISNSRILAGQNSKIVQPSIYIWPARQYRPLTILVLSDHPGPAQQQIAETPRLGLLERPSRRDPL
jgi:hypothetical protein